ADDGLGAIERCAGRRVDDRDRVHLVLRRYEAAGDLAEHHHGEADGEDVDGERWEATPNVRTDELGVTTPGRAERAIEAAEQPAEDAIDHAGQQIARSAVRTQQARGEGR